MEADAQTRAEEGLTGLQFQGGLEGKGSMDVALEDNVQALLQHQRRTAAAFMDYENRVLALELQGLVDRWRTMDIDELSQQNHELRDECLRLQRENMELSRAVAESSLSARRDLAKIEMALEMTVKTKMKEMHDKVKQELYEEMDDKTKKMVSDHGALQDYVRMQAAQADSLDRQYRKLQAERTRLKVDADVATSLSDQQAHQAVEIRRQLQGAYQAIDVLRRRLIESEARGQAAWDEAVRASSRAAVAAAAAARAGLRIGPEADADSAFGMAGEGAEVAALEAQLRHSKQRFERMRLQRDRWRDRALLFERATAQLQAALQTLQDASRCSLPSGVQQDLDSIWCAAKAAAGGAGGGSYAGGASSVFGSSRPSTAQTSAGRVGGHDKSSFGKSGGEAGADSGGAGGGDWVAGPGMAKARAASARPPGPYGTAAAMGQAASSPAAATAAAAGLPTRPHTALPSTGGGGTGGAAASMKVGRSSAAARRAAETIRAAAGGGGRRSVSPLHAPPPPPLSDIEDDGGGGEGGERSRSPSPPGRVPVSRLYNSNEPEPYRVVRQVQYDRPGWPETTYLRPRSPGSRSPEVEAPILTTGGAPVPYLPPSPSPVPSLAAAPPPPPPLASSSASSGLTVGVVRRLPGSVRPHSAVEFTPPPAAALPRWTIGRSLTGLTSSSSTPLPTAAAVAADSPGSSDGDEAVREDGGSGSDSGEAAVPGQPSSGTSAQQPEASPSRGPGAAIGGGGDGGGGGPGGRLGGAGAPPRGPAGPSTVHAAAMAEWQSWQCQRERAQALEPDTVARATAAAAAAAGIPASAAPPGAAAAGHGAAAAAAGPLGEEVSLAPAGKALFGVLMSGAGGAAGGAAAGGGEHGAHGHGAALVPSSRGAVSAPVPEVGLGGGALYTMVHTISAAAAPPVSGAATPPQPASTVVAAPTAGGAAQLAAVGSASGLQGSGSLTSLPSIPSASSDGSFGSLGRLQPTGQPSLTRPATAAATVGGRRSPAVAGPAAAAPMAGTVTAPSAMLAALRAPPTSAQRLGSANVLFSGARASTGRRNLRGSSATAGSSGRGGAGVAE